MDDTKLLEDLVSTYEKFSVPLRMMDGLDEEQFNKFCELLSLCAASWKEADSIPKIAADIFIDAYPAMTAYSHLYDEDEMQYIDQCADKMNDLIRSTVTLRRENT